LCGLLIDNASANAMRALFFYNVRLCLVCSDSEFSHRLQSVPNIKSSTFFLLMFDIISA
jgi:hypothetical protein